MNKKAIGGVLMVALGSAVAILGKKESMKTLEPKTPSEPELDIRTRVVNKAAEEIGPQDPNKYWSEVLPGVSSFKGAWCGGFSLWVLHNAGLAQDVPWEIGKGFCYRLPITKDPQPGDIAYIDQPYQHHAIVESVNNGMVNTIDGNQPGNTVARRIRPVTAITAFYSIDPFIQSSMIQA